MLSPFSHYLVRSYSAHPNEDEEPIGFSTESYRVNDRDIAVSTKRYRSRVHSRYRRGARYASCSHTRGRILAMSLSRP